MILHHRHVARVFPRVVWKSRSKGAAEAPIAHLQQGLKKKHPHTARGGGRLAAATGRAARPVQVLALPAHLVGRAGRFVGAVRVRAARAVRALAVAGGRRVLCDVSAHVARLDGVA